MVAEDAVVADNELVRVAQTGCRNAANHLIDRHYNHVLAYLIRQTNDVELAADVAQETFCDVFLHLRHLSLDRPFAGWLFRIARNNLLHAQRQQRRRPLCLSVLLSGEGDNVSALTVLDSTNTILEQHTLQKLLATLTPTLRQPLLLHYWADLPQERIAQELHISPAAVRQRLKRAREHVRLWYSELEAQ